MYSALALDSSAMRRARSNPALSGSKGNGAAPASSFRVRDDYRRIRRGGRRIVFSSRRWSANQMVVFRMGSDPEPEYSVRCIYSQRSMMQACPHRPEPADLLEMERWMLWVCLQQTECFVGECPNRDCKCTIASPEGGRGVMVHSFVERPAA
jgi:hypothetical protein